MRHCDDGRRTARLLPRFYFAQALRAGRRAVRLGGVIASGSDAIQLMVGISRWFLRFVSQTARFSPDVSWIASRSLAMTVARGVPAADTLHLVRTVIKTSREWPPRGRPRRFGGVIASGSDAIQLGIGEGRAGFGRGRELAGISWIASRSLAMTVARGVPAADTPHFAMTDGGPRGSCLAFAPLKRCAPGGARSGWLVYLPVVVRMRCQRVGSV